jgi:HAD superfamily hydrolase (TIGR01484 family)
MVSISSSADMACGDMPRMRPLADWPLPARSGTRGVLADIDDTLTTDGRVPAAVFAAMERLRANGLLVIAVTGRPAGWCDIIARTWPVDGVVGENGALAFRHDPAARHMVRIYADSPQSRAENRARLERVRDDILAAIPGVRVAADQPFRETDLAIDFNEDVSGLAPETPRSVPSMSTAGSAPTTS